MTVASYRPGATCRVTTCAAAFPARGPALTALTRTAGFNRFLYCPLASRASMATAIARPLPLAGPGVTSSESAGDRWRCRARTTAVKNGP
jgi:hypothetical protein